MPTHQQQILSAINLIESQLDSLSDDHLVKLRTLGRRAKEEQKDRMAITYHHARSNPGPQYIETEKEKGKT